MNRTFKPAAIALNWAIAVCVAALSVPCGAAEDRTIVPPPRVALAADQHLTLRLEDGLPAGGYALPVTIVVPVTAGKGGAGAALAPWYEYGPHTIDGSGLQVAGDRTTGSLSGKTRTGSALPVWTLMMRPSRTAA